MKESQGEKLNVGCLILAGGEGRRLTVDKPLLEIDGRSIIESVAKVVSLIFEEVFLVTNTPEKYRFLGLPHVNDERLGCGPLMGIYSGFNVLKHEVAFVCGADMPFLKEEIIRAEFEELADYDIVVPHPHAFPEFLHAYYRRRCLPVIKKSIDAGCYQLENLLKHSRILCLREEWFIAHGWPDQIGSTFVNINTPEDYQQWKDRMTNLGRNGGSQSSKRRMVKRTPDILGSLAPEVVDKVRRTLVNYETAYEHVSGSAEFSSLWVHSTRVGRIAYSLAESEGVEPTAALLAGLLHDVGKFADGKYHENGVVEEQTAAEILKRLLAGTPYEGLVPFICEAILSLYREEATTSGLGCVLYDADRLDKLGYMGVAQFFAKNALRQHFLDSEMMVRASIELTYAYHAPETLKTSTGRELARIRSQSTRRFYTDLLDEWGRLGLGSFSLRKEVIEDIVCVLIVPDVCQCGHRIEVESDIREAIKCRAAVVVFACSQCGHNTEFTFCLPNVKGFPWRRDCL